MEHHYPNLTCKCPRPLSLGLVCWRCGCGGVQEDNPAETELKLKILEMYNGEMRRLASRATPAHAVNALLRMPAPSSGKLEERKRRKAFVFERDLLVRRLPGVVAAVHRLTRYILVAVIRRTSRSSKP